MRERAAVARAAVALLGTLGVPAIANAVGPDGGAKAGPPPSRACREGYGARAWTRRPKVATATAAAVTGIWISEGWSRDMVISGAPSELWAVAEDGTIAGLGPSAKLFPLHKAALPLRAVAGNRAGEVWAVGDGGTILKWRSPAPTTAWAASPSGVSARLNAVFAPDPQRRWAVGEQGTILRGDARGWTRVVSPVIAGDVTLTAIWGAARDELWVASSGSAALFHHRNGAWTREESGAPGALLAVAGTAADDVWAVGERGAVVHWDGRRWSPAGQGATTVTLRGVWARSKRYAWAVGDGGVSLMWDGARWTPVTTGTTADLLAVAGAQTERTGAGVGLDTEGTLTSLWAGGASGTMLAFTQNKPWICAP